MMVNDTRKVPPFEEDAAQKNNPHCFGLATWGSGIRAGLHFFSENGGEGEGIEDDC